MKNYRYLGTMEGGMGLIGFVAPNKIIEPVTQDQANAIEEVIAADKKAKRDPTFEEYTGRVTESNRATVPMEVYGRRSTPVPDPEVEASPVEASKPPRKPKSKASTPAEKADAPETDSTAKATTDTTTVGEQSNATPQE